MILYALVAGKLPFDDDNWKVVLKKVKKGVYDMPTCIPEDIQGLIKKMLVKNPDERISIADIRKHSWYTSNSNVTTAETVTCIEKVFNIFFCCTNLISSKQTKFYTYKDQYRSQC